MFTLKRKSLSMPSPAEALPGRAEAIPTASNHFVNGAPLKGPHPQGAEMALFGLGYWLVTNQKPPEDLTHEIFPEGERRSRWSGISPIWAIGPPGLRTTRWKT